jgi:hypothetical protein
MFNTQFDRPVMVLLSTMWALAAVLTVTAAAVSFHAHDSVRHVVPTMQTQLAHAKTVESVTSSSMLRQPGLAISKDKLD